MKTQARKSNKRKLFNHRKLSVTIFTIAIISLVGCTKNNTDKVVKEYCELLKNGNYKQILDLAYFPENDFITKDKIEERKESYADEMKKSYDDVLDCTFTKSEENDETISYKLVLETEQGKETETIELNKKENKIIFDDLYDEKSITVCQGSTVYLDDIEISAQPKKDTESGNNVDIYNIVLLNDVPYTLKVTHPLFEDMTTTYEEDETYLFDKSDFKEDFYENFQTNLNDMILDITTTAMQKGNIDTLNKYFLNSNANEFIEDNNLSELISEESGMDKEFTKADKTTIYDIKYINDKELSVYMAVSGKAEISSSNGSQSYIIEDGTLNMVDSYESGISRQLLITCTEQDGTWLISKWSTDFSEED